MSLRQPFFIQSKKAHLPYTKLTGGLFHVFRDFNIMDYKYFLIHFLVHNVSKCNGSECLSDLTFGTIRELALQTGNCQLNNKLK